jgi:ubiquinone/menaquinone biosynthesis C-methylase UbiE
MKVDEVDAQRKYYSQTAVQYDDMHGNGDMAHMLALHFLAGYIKFYDISSILDVGAGTGRAMFWLKQRFPRLTIKGIEPVEALRNQGFAKGISSGDLLPGDAYALEFPDNHFDMVCEFAMLHHVREPRHVVREMSRVAARMVCISDCNFIAQGSTLLRWIKAGIFVSGLWPLANWMKTRGKGYTFSQGDGLAYSYSVFQDVPTLRKNWRTLRITSTEGISDTTAPGPVLTAAQLLLVAMGKRPPARG